MSKFRQPEVIGNPPDLVGLICEPLICEGYVYKGTPEATANTVYLRFGRHWRRLNLDCGVVFWRDQAEDPKPWLAEEEGCEYPHADVGREAGVVGVRLERYQMEATPEGAIVMFLFENGRTIVIEDKDDRTSFRIA